MSYMEHVASALRLAQKRFRVIRRILPKVAVKVVLSLGDFLLRVASPGIKNGRLWDSAGRPDRRFLFALPSYDV
jgi:hypothetical protein